METLKKVLFYVLLPLIVVFVVLQFLSGRDIKEAFESLKKAFIKDEGLAKKQEQANNEANSLRDEANKKKTTKVDSDWHKKKGKK